MHRRGRKRISYGSRRWSRRFLLGAGIIIAAGCWYGLEQFGLVQSLVAVNLSSVVDSIGGVVSVKDLRADYRVSTGQKVRILIVPGHEPDYGGAQFETPDGTIYERNMVAQIGGDLRQFLDENSRYQTFITRNTQAWDPIFADYFKNDWNGIVSWESARKKAAASLTSLGSSSAPPVDHNSAPTDVALRLYGVIKWANENNIDLMIHLHLNDYPGHPAGVAGKYSGLVIYTPAQQYANSTTTKAVADAVFKRLSLYNPVDNLPVESSGLIDDPELIAVGANNTSDAASMLIEYDYLYEPQFVNPKVRSLALKDLAYQTYLGLQDFFTKNKNVSAASSYNPASLYAWNTPVEGPASDPEDIYALQTALSMDGAYPPRGKTRNDCPHSGTFGACTYAAMREFQNKYGIAGEGPGGPRTFVLLQKIYNENAGVSISQSY